MNKTGCALRRDDAESKRRREGRIGSLCEQSENDTPTTNIILFAVESTGRVQNDES
jgi:hypothetical protein